MALARGGWAVLLAEGTLQEQLREREGRQAVAAGVKREKGYSINNKQGLPYSIPYSILLPQKGERSCHYLCQRKRKSFAVHTVNVIRRGCSARLIVICPVLIPIEKRKRMVGLSSRRGGACISAGGSRNIETRFDLWQRCRTEETKKLHLPA